MKKTSLLCLAAVLCFQPPLGKSPVLMQRRLAHGTSLIKVTIPQCTHGVIMTHLFGVVTRAHTRDEILNRAQYYDSRGKVGSIWKLSGLHLMSTEYKTGYCRPSIQLSVTSHENVLFRLCISAIQQHNTKVFG